MPEGGGGDESVGTGIHKEVTKAPAMMRQQKEGEPCTDAGRR